MKTKKIETIGWECPYCKKWTCILDWPRNEEFIMACDPLHVQSCEHLVKWDIKNWKPIFKENTKC